TLQYADVKSVGQELDKAIGDKATSPLAGILRIIPLERLNALLIVTPQPAYLDEAKKWITRLDQAGTGDGPSFFVYNLQNQRAEKLGPLLTQAFTGRAPPPAPAAPPAVAPPAVSRPRAAGRTCGAADGRAGDAGGTDRESAQLPAAAGRHPADDHRANASTGGA